MKTRKLHWGVILITLMWGCAKPPISPPLAPPTFPSAKPRLEKTFGTAVIEAQNIRLEYKKLVCNTQDIQKTLTPGKRILLKNGETFAFASAFADGAYFFEFDNGRHVVVVTREVEEEPVRQFVYDIRDDGKEIHLALLKPKLEYLLELLQPEVFVMIDERTQGEQIDF